MANDSSLKKRIERLETGGSGADLETRLRALAAKLGENPARVLQVVKGREAYFQKEVHDGGRLTWAAFCALNDLLNDSSRGGE